MPSPSTECACSGTAATMPTTHRWRRKQIVAPCRGGGRAERAGLVAQQAVNALADEAFLQAPDRFFAHPARRMISRCVAAADSQQHDLRPSYALCGLLRSAGIAGHRTRCCSHRRKSWASTSAAPCAPINCACASPHCPRAALRAAPLRSGYTQFARASCGGIRLNPLKIGALLRSSLRRIMSPWPRPIYVG